jgi:transcriptional regulator with XRE-family HTH domain
MGFCGEQTAAVGRQRKKPRCEGVCSCLERGVPSLRQLAKELGASASYLSQVRCGKRPASVRLQGVIDAYRTSVRQNANNAKQFTGQNGKISRSVVLGEVLELADRHGLGPCAARRGSSSLPFPIKLRIAKSP